MFPIRDHNPSDRTPFVTYALLVINVAVFAMMFGADPRTEAEIYVTYGLVPAIGAPETYVTSVFLHGGIMHLAGNMLFLWIFGDNLEDQMGHLGFLAFYLAGGVGAGLAQVLADPTSPVPIVGASGAIAAVMGGYLLLFPRARIDILLILIVFFKIFTVPSWIMLGLWFALQIYNGVASDPSGGGVAYWAHAGGFIVGIVLTLPLWLRRGGAGFWRRTDGHPDYPEADYKLAKSSVPRIRRR